MSLLNEADKREIRDAVKLVTDTFMVTPFTYYIGGANVDIWAESLDDATFYSIELKGFKEEGKNDRDKLKKTPDGTVDEDTVQLTLNIEDLKELELIADDFKTIFDKDLDYLKLQGILYKVSHIYSDGALDAQDCLVIIEAERSDKLNSIYNDIQISGGSEIPISIIGGVDLISRVEDLESVVSKLDKFGEDRDGSVEW